MSGPLGGKNALFKRTDKSLPKLVEKDMRSCVDKLIEITQSANCTSLELTADRNGRKWKFFLADIGKGVSDN